MSGRRSTHTRRTKSILPSTQKALCLLSHIMVGYQAQTDALRTSSTCRPCRARPLCAIRPGLYQIQCSEPHMHVSCTGRNLYESQIIMEYLEDISPQEASLFPKDPMDKANARLWMDHIAKKICPIFFHVLQAQACVPTLQASRLHSHTGGILCSTRLCWDAAARKRGMAATSASQCVTPCMLQLHTMLLDQHKAAVLCQEKPMQKEAEEELLSALSELVEAMDPQGPFFLGTFFSFVDIMLLPWLSRPQVMKELKGFEVPSSGSAVWERYARWLEAGRARPSVIETTSEIEHYLQILERYAKNEAQSEAAKATRAGKRFS